jgi:hypothetical protein
MIATHEVLTCALSTVPSMSPSPGIFHHAGPVYS